MSLNFDHNNYFTFIIFILFILSLFFINKYEIRNIKIILLLRVLLFLSLFFLLSNPKINMTSSSVNQLKWNIYLDKSLSMNYHQQPSPTSYRLGINTLLEKLKKKEIGFNLFSFGNRVEPGWDYINQKLEDGSTNLGEVISHIKSEDKNIAGSLIISDGQENFGKQITQNNILGLNTIHVIGVGANESLVDVMINSLIAPPAVIKGEKAEVKVEVSASGSLDEKINVALLSNGKILGSKLVKLSGSGSKKEVRFLIQPLEMGEINYFIQASTVPEEINILNNKQSFEIQVLKDNYKIAMISGAPNFNTRIIKNMIHSNKNFTLDHYVYTSEKYSKPIQEFWETKYDLIIFDNNPIEENKAEWEKFLRVFAKKILSQKTSLALLPGYDINIEAFSLYMSLLDLKLKSPLIALDDEYSWDLNTNWTSFFPFTNDNFNSVKAIDNPPIYVNMEIDSVGANVLADFSISDVRIPLIVIKEKHPLRGLVFTSPDLNKIFFEGNDYSQKLKDNIFNPMFSWLMKTGNGNEFYFRTDKNNYQQGEQIKILGKSIDNKKLLNGIINIFSNGEKINSKPLNFNLETGLYTGKFWASKSGTLDYEILSITEDSAINVSNGTIKVQDSQIELNNVFLNKHSLTDLTSFTGGTFNYWNDRSDIIEKINLNFREDSYKNEISLKSSRVILILLFSFLILDWLMRKRLGLL